MFNKKDIDTIQKAMILLRENPTSMGFSCPMEQKIMDEEEWNYMLEKLLPRFSTHDFRVKYNELK